MFSTYCSFYNNSFHSTRCIYLAGNKGNISKSNIILNNSPSDGAIYFGSGNFYLIECIFDQNLNILLGGYSGT